jgi:hypothetical protein
MPKTETGAMRPRNGVMRHLMKVSHPQPPERTTMATLTPLLERPVTSEDEAKAWITELHAQGLMFHFDDSPETVGTFVGGQWRDLFTPEQCVIIRARLDEVYHFEFEGYDCPIGYALHVMDARSEWLKGVR